MLPRTDEPSTDDPRIEEPNTDDPRTEIPRVVERPIGGTAVVKKLARSDKAKIPSKTPSPRSKFLLFSVRRRET